MPKRGAKSKAKAKETKKSKVDAPPRDLFNKDTWTTLKTSAEYQNCLMLLFEKLKTMENQQQLSDVHKICPILIDEQVLDVIQSNKHLKILLCSCILEVLRIFAPDVPWSNHDLHDAFELIITQLKSLQVNTSTQDQDYDQLSFMLESLAQVKSCILMIGLDQLHEEEEEDAMNDPLILKLFTCLFSTLTSEHSMQIESFMLSIMQSCIDEMDSISDKLLEAILSPLVLSFGKRSYEMAQQLIANCSEQLQAPISKYFNSLLVEGNSSQKKTEVSEHGHKLIYELHKINPSLLLYVLPNVCLQLQVDDIKTRHDAIALMGRLFASARADYGTQYMKNFREFLGRFRDREADIRLQMIQVCTIILQRKPELGDAIRKELRDRLSDPDWEVRRRSVNEICDAAALDLSAIDMDTLIAVGERMKDKKAVIVKETMTGLSQIYAEHISKEIARDPLNSNALPTEKVSKLDWIPNLVFKCFAYRDHDLRVRVVQLFDDILLPRLAEEHERMECFFFIYQGLDTAAKEALRRVLLERKKCHLRLRNYLEFREKHSKTKLSLSSDVLNSMAEVLPVNDISKAKQLITQLTGLKDKKIFAYLKTLTTICPADSDAIAVYKKHRADVVKAIGTNTELGGAIKSFTRVVGMTFFSYAAPGIVIEAIDTKLDDRKSKKCVHAAFDFLVMLSQVFPQVFFIHELQMSLEAYLKSEDRYLILHTLHVLGNVAEFKLQSSSPLKLAVSTSKLLQHQCLEGTIEQAEAAAKCLAMVEDSSPKRKLCMKTMQKNANQSHWFFNTSLLQSLVVLCKYAPAIVEEFKIRMFGVLIVQFETIFTPGTRKSDFKPAQQREWYGLVLRLLINLMVYVEKPDDEDEESLTLIQQKCDQLLELLYDILDKGGRMTPKTSATEAATYREIATLSLLKLTTVSVYEKAFSLRQWHQLGYMIQDPSETLASKILQKLQKRFLTQAQAQPPKHQQLHKYLAYLVLTASSPNVGLRKQARQILINVMQRMRLLHSRKLTLEAADSASSHSSAASIALVPEYLIPFVIHLLLHHPSSKEDKHGDSDAEEESYKDFKMTASGKHAGASVYLAFLLDVLVSNVASEVDNLSFIFQILDTMNHSHDVCSTTRQNNQAALQELIQLAIELLRKKIKTQRSLKPYPGKIFLPKDLYQFDPPGHQRPSPKAEARLKRKSASPSPDPTRPKKVKEVSIRTSEATQTRVTPPRGRRRLSPRLSSASSTASTPTEKTITPSQAPRRSSPRFSSSSSKSSDASSRSVTPKRSLSKKSKTESKRKEDMKENRISNDQVPDEVEDSQPQKQVRRRRRGHCMAS